MLIQSEVSRRRAWADNLASTYQSGAYVSIGRGVARLNHAGVFGHFSERQEDPLDPDGGGENAYAKGPLQLRRSEDLVGRA